MALPSDAKERKDVPMATGLLDYFPDALAAVAAVSKIGNDQHNPGEPLHWAREKSMDQADCIVRHLIDRGTIDTDGVRHSAKVAWRALALLQLEIEADTKTEKVNQMFEANLLSDQTRQEIYEALEPGHDPTAEGCACNGIGGPCLQERKSGEIRREDFGITADEAGMQTPTSYKTDGHACRLEAKDCFRLHRPGKDGVRFH